jgi:tetratricopeptide (TPR) repeat protein
MIYRALLLLLWVTLGACAVLEYRPQPDSAAELSSTATDTLSAADRLAAEGRWSEALALMDSAAKARPGEPAVEAGRAAMQARWERQKRVFDDQIMVGDAENQSRKIAILEKLARAQPGDLVVTSRRIYWKEVLASSIEALTACGEYHVNSDTALARRCFQLASGMHAPEETDQRLAVVGEKLRMSEALAAERQRARLEQQRQRRARHLLEEAKAAIEARDYRRALDILATVAELQPDNAEVTGLQETAWSMISPQVEALVKLGDHLYLDEQLEAAVATWQAALSLKPGDEAILARVDRAETVLTRLDDLRRQQRALPAAVEPPSD